MGFQPLPDRLDLGPVAGHGLPVDEQVVIALARKDMDVQVSHEETNKGARIRAVIDYIREQFRQDEREWFSITRRAAVMQA